MDRKRGQNCETNEVKNHQISWYLGPRHVEEGQDLEFLVKNQSWDEKIKKIEKSDRNFGCQNLDVVYNFQNFEKNKKNDQNPWYLGPAHVLEGQDLEFLVKKQFREQKKKKIKKIGTNFGSYKKSWKFQNFILVPGVQKNDF